MNRKGMVAAAVQIMNAIKGGDAICRKCGEIMKRTPDPEGGFDAWLCPSCGYKIPDDEYENEGNNAAS